MADKRKKKTELPVEEAQPVAPAPVPAPENDGLLALTTEELLRLRLAEQEAQTAMFEGRLAALQVTYLTNQLDPKGLIAAAAASQVKANQAFGEAKTTYQQQVRQIAARLGLDSNSFAFDPATGVVRTPDNGS